MMHDFIRPTTVRRIKLCITSIKSLRNHSIFRLDTHLNLTYLCAVTFNNNDYGKRKSKLPGGV